MPETKPVKGCKTCGHALQKKTGIIGSWVGECRAVPPYPLALPVPNGMRIQFVWPVVDETIFCGQYCPNNSNPKGFTDEHEER
jgi:hypothetical protein